MLKTMKKISLLLASIFFILVKVVAQTPTGTGDDFERSSLGTAWTSNAQNALSLSTPTATPINTQLLVICSGAGVNYSGFTYTFPASDLRNFPYVTVKVKSSNAITLRIDMLDITGKRTNQVDTKLSIEGDGKYHDYVFDFTGKFNQQFNTPVDATQITKIEFMVNPAAAGTPGFTGTFVMDSVMVGSRAKIPALGTKTIKLNQVGFFTDGYKAAVVHGATSNTFTIVDESNTIKYTGTLSTPASWTYSGETVQKADFSTFKTPGRYKMVIAGVPNSYPFTISETILNKVSKSSIKGFYYQRASTALPQLYAEKWFRASGHPDNNVLIHSSAVSPGRAANSTISSPKGWYDAGDYNKYIVNSGISTYTLLACYEHFPTYYDTLKLKIPESTNNIPDVLDEALWNLRWMFTMQDPYDGGVYHKLTNTGFDGSVMPANANSPRYVVQKSTAAALDFTAVMAQSARIFANFKTELPGLSDSCMKAATNAYAWAIANPAKYYVQSALPAPAISTGTYSDGNITDEFAWAAAELFTTTLDKKYYETFKTNISQVGYVNVPSWQNVGTLSYISMGHNRVILSSELTTADTIAIKKKIIDIATPIKEASITSAYGVAMGVSGGDFNWGSNSTAANQSFVLIQAFNYTKDSSYLKAALSNVDYLLGRNATDYSFVTGEGTFYSNDPHHRPSQADNIAQAVPGLLVGGPNKNPDKSEPCPTFPSKDALSYIDNSCSFSTNEIAINWNAPLAYITGSIQSIYSGIEPVAKTYEVKVATANKNAVMKNVNITLYPNPTSSSLYIVKPFDLIESPIILDLNGNEYPATGTWNNDTFEINTANLTNGMYMIRLQGENGAAVQKFTILK